MSVKSMYAFPELVPANDPLSVAPKGRAYPNPFTQGATALRSKNVQPLLVAFAFGMLLAMVLFT
jgi:hypothetical protein